MVVVLSDTPLLVSAIPSNKTRNNTDRLSFCLSFSLPPPTTPRTTIRSLTILLLRADCLTNVWPIHCILLQAHSEKEQGVWSKASVINYCSIILHKILKTLRNFCIAVVVAAVVVLYFFFVV